MATQQRSGSGMQHQGGDAPAAKPRESDADDQGDTSGSEEEE
jgi:hypothetical protein